MGWGWGDTEVCGQVGRRAHPCPADSRRETVASGGFQEEAGLEEQVYVGWGEGLGRVRTGLGGGERKQGCREVGSGGRWAVGWADSGRDTHVRL